MKGPKHIRINYKRFITFWILTLILTSIFTVAITTIVLGKEKIEGSPDSPIEQVYFFTPKVQEYEHKHIEEFREMKQNKKEPLMTSLGEYTITAYCSCEKCCGEYAKDRPLDSEGNPIVYGAYGIELTPNYSVAAPLPYGKKIEIEGMGVYEVMDTTAQWVVDRYQGKIIDLYVSSHEEAENFKLIKEVKRYE